jgi:hypothetical protein
MRPHPQVLHALTSRCIAKRPPCSATQNTAGTCRMCCSSFERNGSSTTSSRRVPQRCLGPLLSLQCGSARTQPTMIEASGRHCVREDIRLEEKDHT